LQWAFPDKEQWMRRVRGAILLSSILIIFGLGITAFMLFWGPDHIQLEARSLGELLKSGEIVPFIAVPLVLIITAFAMRPVIRMAFPPEIKNGVTAQARVTKVWDTGVSINDNPQVGLLLHVTPSMSAAFDVEAKTLVSRLNAALVQPGITVEIKYDPQNPKRLQIINLNVKEIGSGGAESRLEELKTLLDRRLITEDEYNKKREEIIKAL
jgi:hypothetical protein